jgi:hypothetical protein
MTPLREALRSRDERLLQQVESLVDRATPQLWHTWSTFPSGTKHTPEHTYSVELIASLMLPDDAIAAIEDDELAVLILACHFHDLGMAGTEADNATPDGRDRVRKEHAISIGDRIRERWRELGFENQIFADILAEVCRGHRPDKVDGVANWDSLPTVRNVAPTRFVRLHLVSAMIYAADELHLGDDRAPKREEEWKEISTAESLRHWRRHQAVSGPTRPNEKIRFDGTVSTLSMERDLRRVFRKAFLAVADLRRELSNARIADSVPGLEIQWLREPLWKLLITKVCGDRVPRTRESICAEVLGEFENSEPHLEALTDLCSEEPTGQTDLSIQIKRAVSDFLTRGFLAPSADPVLFQLAADFRTAEYLLELTREADEVERLFGGPAEARHEQAFYESETGKRFIRDCIFPEVKASYAVDVATMPKNASLRTAIESSPTACRVVRQISTPVGNLVKHDLLLVAVTAGVCFDLMNNPEAVLDKSLRQAIHDVFSQTAERLPRFLNFIQELAIVKALSVDQVRQIVIPSPSMRNELTLVANKRVDLKVSQTVPTERRDWAFPYLLLAGRRANEPITILNSPEAPFRISIDSDDEALTRFNEENALMVSIEPGSSDVSSVVTLRAGISFDGLRGVLTFTCHKLSAVLQDNLPVIVELPATLPPGPMKISFSFVQTALRAGQLLDLERAAQLALEKELELQFQILGVGLLGSLQYTREIPLPMPAVLSIEKLRVLAELDPEIPVPYLARKGLPERVVNAEPENRSAEFQAVKDLLTGEKPAVSSVTLRLATVDGQDYREEFLGCLPLGFHFNAPEIRGGAISQEELNRLWASGDENFKVSVVCREDVHDLAAQIRDWMGDTTQPFPIECNNDLQFHYCTTRLEMEHLKHVDRLWYVERPVIFRLCPVMRAEQYRVEMEYWRSKGDELRAQLLEELKAQAEKDELSTAGKEKTAPETHNSDPPPA